MISVAFQMYLSKIHEKGAQIRRFKSPRDLILGADHKLLTQNRPPEAFHPSTPFQYVLFLHFSPNPNRVMSSMPDFKDRRPRRGNRVCLYHALINPVFLHGSGFDHFKGSSVNLSPAASRVGCS